MYVRRWDYSSWARTGKPIVREITEPPQSTACVFIDTTLDPRPTHEQSLAFEAALSVSAGLVDRLLSADWSIDLFCVGPTQLNSSARSQSVSLDAMLETLARAHGTSADEFEEWKKIRGGFRSARGDISHLYAMGRTSCQVMSSFNQQSTCVAGVSAQRATACLAW